MEVLSVSFVIVTFVALKIIKLFVIFVQINLVCSCKWKSLEFPNLRFYGKIYAFFLFLRKLLKLQVSSDFDKSEISNDWGGEGGALDPSVEFSALLFLFDLDDFP